MIFASSIHREPITLIIEPQEYILCASTFTYTYPFTAYEIIDLIIYNPTALITAIHATLSAHNVHKNQLVIVLTGNTLFEQLSETYQEFTMPGYAIEGCQLPNTQWYFAGIPLHSLWQFTLLSSSLGLNLIAITTKTYAYLLTDQHQLPSTSHCIANALLATPITIMQGVKILAHTLGTP